MPRSARRTSLKTRTARLANKIRRAPYFVKIAKGLHLGYYRGSVSGSWIARRYTGNGTYDTNALGCADNTLDADGIEVLDYWQAQEAAKGWAEHRNPSLALRWLTLAAEAGDPVGQRNLAALYFKGVGVEHSHERAANLYRAASEAGDAAAQDMLSWMLLEEGSVVFDPVEARRWSLAAVQQGVAVAAMTRVGMIYHNALGVGRDPNVAARWLTKAAARGDAGGQAMLGAAHILGAGVAYARAPQR